MRRIVENKWPIAAAVGLLGGYYLFRWGEGQFAVQVLNDYFRSAHPWFYAGATSLFTLFSFTTVFLASIMVINNIHGFRVIFGESRRTARGKLAKYPWQTDRLEVVVGEVHDPKSGEEVEDPQWLTIPRGGLVTGTIVVGGIGSGKTAGALYPFTRQILSHDAGEPSRKCGGLVMDAKGDFIYEVRKIMREAGREEDLVEIGVDGKWRYNPLGNGEIIPSALAGTVGALITNSYGKSREPFWEMAYTNLTRWIITLCRVAFQRVTLLDVYKLATDEEKVKSLIKYLSDIELAPEPRGYFEAARYWFEKDWGALDYRVKSSVVESMTAVISMFDDPKLRLAFCPTQEEENFPGFESCITDGKVVALNLPVRTHHIVARVVATLLKLEFETIMLNRIHKDAADPTRNTERHVLFVCDEYQVFATSYDAWFFSESRQAKVVPLVATQTYSSVVEAMGGNEALARVLTASFRNKILMGQEDQRTAHEQAEFIGKVDKIKVNRSLSESGSQSSFSLLSGSLLSDQSAVSESTSYTVTREFEFDEREIMSLKTFQAIARIFTGSEVLTPRKVYLKPYWLDPNASFFDQVRSGKLELTG